MYSLIYKIKYSITSFVDQIHIVTAIQDIIATTFPSLQSFTGDPCLPLGYKYSWIDCDYTSQPLPRVTSMCVFDYNY